MRLYHTGYLELKNPDVHYGRKNADFCQGFYLTGDKEFAERWARERSGMRVWVNEYELDTDSLRIKRFSRDGEWYDYIFQNRAGGRDALAGYDVIIGPIANDTIFDTWGIITSGLLKREEALPLLSVGPAYEQIALKTERAAAQLLWLSARTLESQELARRKDAAAREEAAYQALFAQAMEKLSGDGEE